MVGIPPAVAWLRPTILEVLTISFVAAPTFERTAPWWLRCRYDKTEDDLKALQSVGQIIGEVLRQLDDERCEQSRVGICATAALSVARV